MKTVFWEDFIVRLCPENEQDKAWLIAYTRFCKSENMVFLLEERDEKGDHKQVPCDYFSDETDNEWEEMYALNIYPCPVA